MREGTGVDEITGMNRKSPTLGESGFRGYRRLRRCGLTRRLSILLLLILFRLLHILWIRRLILLQEGGVLKERWVKSRVKGGGHYLFPILLNFGNPLRGVEAKSCNCECDILRTPRFSGRTAEGLCSAIPINLCCGWETLDITHAHLPLLRLKLFTP